MPYEFPIQFGKYFLTRRVAVGGMAEVFKAKLVGIKGFEKTLAVKKILPEFNEDEEFVQMFVDEARISSNLHHSNIVQVFDFGKVDHSYYIAMEYIDGPNLRNLLQRYLKTHGGSFPRNAAIYILIQIARALDYAHNVHLEGTKNLDLVHRDVSPQNVLISRTGEIKITDFGIAKAAIKLSKTQPGKIQGKFSYMSPEQALGKPLDRRSDIFSLGIIGYELLSGVKAYGTEDTHQRYKLVRDAQIPRLASLVPDLPSQVESLIMQMLLKDPSDRPESCAEVATRLSDFLSDVSAPQLSSDLGTLVEELFPRERSSSIVNDKIQAMLTSEPHPPMGAVQSQVVLPQEKEEKSHFTKAHKDESTVANWPALVWQSKLAKTAIASLVLALLTLLWYRHRLEQDLEETATPSLLTSPEPAQSESPLPSAPPQASPSSNKVNELTQKLEDAEQRAEDVQRELAAAERKLKEKERQVQKLEEPSCPPDMAMISPGDFWFGSSPNDPDRNDLVEPPATKLPNARYCIDKFEYPNRRGSTPKTWVTWVEAQTLCTAEGKRLCSQEEWERACKGPGSKNNRRFPYGDGWDSNRCNTEKRDTSTGETTDRNLVASGVFTKCMSPEGVYDLSGNADEWTASRGRFSTEGRVTHGGSSHSPAWASRCSSLREVLATSKEPEIGFRCCKDAL